MPNINIRIIGSLADIIGKTDLNISTRAGATLLDVLTEAAEKYGEDIKDRIVSPQGGFQDYIIATINGIDVREREGIRTPIEDGDKISVSQVVVGG